MIRESMPNRRFAKPAGVLRGNASIQACLLISAAALWCSPARAIPPPFVSDEELARSPTIVVAKWENAPLVPHHRVEGNVWKEQEIRTEIVVKRVLKGTLKPGKYTILLGPFLAWESEKGGNVKAYTSTEMVGDVNDVKDENLWFLESRRSWDKTDPATYPALDTYRGVQPRVLEPYFLALAGKAPAESVPKLLASREPAVVLRTLQYVAGGILPWPYQPVRALREARVAEETAGRACRGRSIASWPERGPKCGARPRPCTLNWQGAQAIPRMRTSLSDPDGHIRGIAIGTLARLRRCAIRRGDGEGRTRHRGWANRRGRHGASATVEEHRGHRADPHRVLGVRRWLLPVRR